MSVLDELVAGAVEDQRSRENNVPLAEVKRMAFESSPRSSVPPHPKAI